MLLLTLLLSLIACSTSIDTEALNLKVKYLEDLINEEVEAAKHYDRRYDNRDLLGDLENSKDIHDFGNFDFIIIGGGTSGSVVATRLSELMKWKILLLEAGNVNDDLTDIPYLLDPAGKSDRNWGYVTVPQKYGCYGRRNRQCPYPRGKILGGSGSINQMVYARSTKDDFDKWAKLGNPDWSWDKVLPFFKKLENFQSPNLNSKYRGFNGPLNVGYVKPGTLMQQVFIKANEEIGIPFVADYNEEKVGGVSIIQQTIQKGKRASGANNYIRPAWYRMNLNVTLKAFVTKILINHENKTAHGVEFIHGNRKFKAHAKKEVILSAGAVNSPQLLMLSGVGPKSDLEKLGIKVIQDSPVGKYMRDHLGFTYLYFNSNYKEPVLKTKQLVEQYLNGEGAATTPLYRAISYYNVRNESSSTPDMEIDFVPQQPFVETLPQFSNFKKEVVDYVNSINPATHWNLHLFLLHPKSTGTLTLRTGSARDFPLIDSKTFENVEDLEDMYEGIQVALKLLDTSVGKKYNLTVDLNLPGCSQEKRLSKAYWLCHLRQLANPGYHLSSTATMGPLDGSLAVVDNNLKVYGIKNLRVIDASIAPTSMTGHMNAVAFLIGEKGADFVKKDHENFD